jgi:UDP-glucuronate decarboxylase
MAVNRIVAEDVERILQADLSWERFAGATVMVTGAGGFLARYLVEVLAALNAVGSGPRILGIVRDLKKARHHFAHLLDRGILDLIQHDISLPLPAGLPRADFVIHAASNASPKFYGRDPVGTMSANTSGTTYILDYAKKSCAQGVLYFSSGEVYGIPLDANLAVTEDAYGYLDPTKVRSCYAESKRCGETMCVSWAHQFQVPAKIVRPFHTYGPGMALDDGRVFADFVADAVACRDIVLRSDGNAIRPFCYLADATLGFLHVLLKGECATAYNVANPDAEIAIRDLADLIAGIHPAKGLKVARPSTNDVPTSYLKSDLHRALPSIDRVRSLGWRPTTSILDGFRRTIESYAGP